MAVHRIAGLVLACCGLASVWLAPGCAARRGEVRSDLADPAGAGGLRAAARGRAAAEIPCSDGSLFVRSLGYGGYRVEGCGQWITYTCVKGAAGVVCAPNERGASVVDPAHDWTDDDVRMLISRVHDDLAACLPDATPSLLLEVLLRPDGRVVRTGRAQLAPELSRCVDGRLTAEHLGRAVVRLRVVSIQVTRASAHTRAGAVTPPPAPDVGARAAMDRHADAILACVEADRLSMQVSWGREGRLDVLLLSERQGTPEEACVRAIVQRLTIPAPGAPGSIVHVVQR